MTLVQNIILVDELHQIVAAFLHTSHQGHESGVVTLSIELRLKNVALENWKASGQGLSLANDFMV